jgi:hypothetical protein
MKVAKNKKKNTESFYILGYILELITKIWRFGNLFPPKSGDVVSTNYPFYIGRNHIFQVKIWAKEKHWKLEVQASERASEPA